MGTELHPGMSQKTVARIRGDSEPLRPRQPITAPSNNHLNASWPELRIVRTAQTEPADITADWVDYLNDLGRRNSRKGVAPSLGSVALVYVRAEDMGRMLEEKYQNAYTDRKRTALLQKKIADGIQYFVRTEQERRFDDVTIQIEIAQELAPQPSPHTSTGDISIETPLYGEFDGDDQDNAAEPHWRGREILLPADAREELRHSQTLFSDLTLQASNIQLYENDGFGLNLSANDELHAERQALLEYLRIDEGLKVNRLASIDWQAHATIFTPTQNLGSTQLVAPADRPATIMFDQPRAF